MTFFFQKNWRNFPCCLNSTSQRYLSSFIANKVPKDNPSRKHIVSFQERILPLRFNTFPVKKRRTLVGPEDKSNVMLIAVSCLTWLDLNHQVSTSPGVCHRSSKHETTQTPFDVVRYWRGGFGRPQNDTAVYREVGLGKFTSWVRVGKTTSIHFFFENFQCFTTLPEKTNG